jgi:alginate O-acetyltransferase complex protein AlgI
MLFSSPLFLFQFLPLVLLAYFALDRRFHNLVLLIASLFFYAWGEVWLVSLMLLSIVANYSFGLWATRELRAGGGRLAVTAALMFNIGILFFFKYADWLWMSLGTLFSGHPVEPLGGLLVTSAWGHTALLTATNHLRLPLGISFFTFQAMSYVIDVHRRDVEAQRNLLDFALYKSLFPQLIAGPIVRYRDVHDQVTSRTATWPRFALGVRRFVLGLGKKMLVANAAAEVADKILDMPEGMSTSLAWLGMLAYTIQIYFDFSGYSDMAIGLGHMFGFDFLENFDHPYVSRSVTEFWRRWHISLSTWFRDYLYIPLGGNRGSPTRTYFNLVLVFFLCGLWHGASVNFVIWGLYHGGFLVIERLGLGRRIAAMPAWLRHVYLLLVVMIGWVFFRAHTLPQALVILKAMCGGGAAAALQPLGLFVDSYIATALIAGVIGSIPWLPTLQAWMSRKQAFGWSGRIIALETLGLLMILLVLAASSVALASNSYNPFIYFRF